eukprot:5896779-Pyramimonas_sp.AAC.1
MRDPRGARLRASAPNPHVGRACNDHAGHPDRCTAAPHGASARHQTWGAWEAPSVPAGDACRPAFA